MSRSTKRHAMIQILFGVVMIVIGGLITMFTLGSETRTGGKYIASFGPILAGVIALVSGFLRLSGSSAAATAPAEPATEPDDPEPVDLDIEEPLEAPATTNAIMRRAAGIGGAIATVVGATWFGAALHDDDLSLAAIATFVAGVGAFGWAQWTSWVVPAKPGQDLWDRAVTWIEQRGAIAALLLLTIIVSMTFARIFQGETVGDDLTFHMAESARLADCIRAGDWDLWNPSANGGYASAYYYQVIPQLASALPTALFGHHLFWFQISLWIPLVLAPAAAYRGIRLMGGTPWQSLFAAFAIAFLSGASRWGTGADGTFQVGLYTQTWALAAFPLGLGHGVRWLLHGKHLPSAIAWGAFVFLCHPFASIALCLGLAFGVLAHYLTFPVRGKVLKLVLLGVLGVAFAMNAFAMVLDRPVPATAGAEVPLVKYIYVAPLILFAGLIVRVATSGRLLTKLLLVGVALALVANAVGFATITAVPKKPDGAVTDLPAVWSIAAASLYIGPLLLLAAIAGRLAFGLRGEARAEPARPRSDVFVRLVVLGGCLLVATLPGWLTVIVDRDGFGGFPHRVNDEVGPGYKELMGWFSKGALLDNWRYAIQTWMLPIVFLFARMRFARWLWAPALVYATLLALGPHAPTTADDLLPAVRFLGAMQVVLALGIGAGAFAIGRAIWHVRPGSLLHRCVVGLAGKRPHGELVYGVRTVVIALAFGLVIFVALPGVGKLAHRVRVLETESYDYRDEIMEMNTIIAKQPQGRKQVGPGCENHWWNLLSYVYVKRPALLQMGGGGLQASPNYDFLWSVRDFPKLAWVYDTPLFLFAKASSASAPQGDVLGETKRYELRRLPAPGIVSPVQVTGVLPEGESRAKSKVRIAAIEWLKSQAPLDDHVLAYHGYGDASPAPDAKVIRAFRVDPSPGASADIYAEVDVKRKTTFVARESWHPRWHAYVDGIEVPIRRVTPDFPAIDVEPGKHVLAFRFERPWWAHAAWLAWPGMAIGAWLGIRALRRRRNRGNLPPARIVD